MIVKTYCARMDHGGCDLLVHVEDGRIVRIEGDSDSPLNRGGPSTPLRAIPCRVYREDEDKGSRGEEGK